jgi:hypothetical protein
MNDRVEGRLSEAKPQSAVAFEPAPIERRRGRFDSGIVAVIAAIVLVGAALVRPWGDLGGGQAELSPAPATIAQPGRSQASQSPAEPSAPPAIDLARAALDRLISGPTGHAADWGLAIGAGTPSQDGAATFTEQESVISTAPDGSWSVWAQVEPKPSSMPAPGVDPALGGLAAVDLCKGVPDLPSGAEVVALTAPGQPREHLQVRGWQVTGWHDEPRTIDLLPSTRNLARTNVGAINELTQAAGGPWPDGRYEFLVDGSTDESLTVCLGFP